MMKKLLALWVVVCLSLTAVAADNTSDNKSVDRVKSAATVLNEIQSAPDTGIPQEVLGSAECVAVVPSMLKGGFVFGARYGRGVASCRTPKGWSAPAFFAIEGGSFGLQIGGEAVDLVMLVMNQEGVRNLLSSKFKLGADASVAAGPWDATLPPTPTGRCAPRCSATPAPAALSPDSNSAAPSSTRTKTAPVNSTGAWCPSKLRSAEKSRPPEPRIRS